MWGTAVITRLQSFLPATSSLAALSGLCDFRKLGVSSSSFFPPLSFSTFWFRNIWNVGTYLFTKGLLCTCSSMTKQSLVVLALHFSNFSTSCACFSVTEINCQYEYLHRSVVFIPGVQCEASCVRWIMWLIIKCVGATFALLSLIQLSSQLDFRVPAADLFPLLLQEARHILPPTLPSLHPASNLTPPPSQKNQLACQPPVEAQPEDIDSHWVIGFAVFLLANTI